MTLISSPGLKGRPSSSQHCVDCRNTVCWSLNLHKVVRLHQPRRRLKTQQTFLRKADDAKELKRRRTKAKTATSSCRKLQSELTMRKAEYTTLLAVGMTWPPPLCRGSWAITASRILNLTFLMAESITKTNEFISVEEVQTQRHDLRSSHRGPSLVPHWNPWTMLSLTEPSSALST